MSEVDDNSVALVVTSPPYFAGKAYETELDAGHIPSTYLEYLTMLRDVFAECVRVLEPGGRMCVNVANLGRKPYRSLAGDVTTILQDELAMLLRGEVVWVKAKGAAGSCAFGSYMKASNPVLRDLSERVVIASKGRFDRAIPAKERATLGLPHESDITKEEFLASTLDVWEIRPERARRVGHPAPFPVELPERFIHLYTYAATSSSIRSSGPDRRPSPPPAPAATTWATTSTRTIWRSPRPASPTPDPLFCLTTPTDEAGRVGRTIQRCSGPAPSP